MASIESRKNHNNFKSQHHPFLISSTFGIKKEGTIDCLEARVCIIIGTIQKMFSLVDVPLSVSHYLDLLITKTFFEKET
jgi:hypothetical protein